MSAKQLTAKDAERINQENPTNYQIGIGTVLKELTNNTVGLTVKTGVGAGSTIDLSTEKPNQIVAVLAVVTATGAFATKSLLAVTTDYTFVNATDLLTCVTAQSSNTLLIFYK